MLALERYVYYQCRSKLEARFNLRIRPGGEKLFVAFCSVEVSNVGAEIQQNDIPFDVLHHDETWLAEELKARAKKPFLTVDHQISGSTYQHLVRSPECLQALYAYVRGIIYAVDKATRNVVKWEGGKPDERMEPLTENLDRLAKSMRWLCRGVYKSPAVWCLLRDASVGDAIVCIYLHHPACTKLILSP